MRFKKRNIAFWVAVIISLAAAISLFATLNYIYKPVKTVVVAKAVQPGEQLQADDIKEDTVFAGDLNPRAVFRTEDIIGKYAASHLYPGEQVIADRLINEPEKATGAFSYLKENETYVAFNSNEARWPKGIKEGDTVTAVAVLDEQARIVGQGFRVIGTDKPVPILGQIEAMKQAVPDNASSLTIAVSRDAVAELLYIQSNSKAFYFLPEHPVLAEVKFQ